MLRRGISTPQKRCLGYVPCPTQLLQRVGRPCLGMKRMRRAHSSSQTPFSRGSVANEGDPKSQSLHDVSAGHRGLSESVPEELQKESVSWKEVWNIIKGVRYGQQTTQDVELPPHDTERKKSLDKDTVYNMLALLKPEKVNLAVATSTVFATTAVSLALPKAVGTILDIAMQNSTGDMTSFGLLLAACFGIQSVLIALRTGLLSISSERLGAKLRASLFDNLLYQDTSFFDKSRVGDLTNRLSNDVTIVQKAITSNIVGGMRSFLVSIGGLSMLVYLSPKLAMISVVALPITAVSAVYFGKYMKRQQQRVQHHLGKALSVGEEALVNIRVVRQFTNEALESGKFRTSLRDSLKEAMRVGVAGGCFDGIVHLCANLSIIGVLGYGGTLISTGEISPGDLTSFLMYSLYVGFNFSALSTVYSELLRGAGAAERVFDIIERKPEDVENGPSKTILENIQGEVAFENVTFRYEETTDDTVNGLSFTAKPGDVVGITGPSGSGKSTIISLLTKLYEPNDGKILIDGTDLSQVDARWWRTNVGVIQQEPPLFSGSILENIRYGNPSKSDEEVFEAAKLADATEFIKDLPLQFDASVGERGVRLSGGQKQRIAIARVILRDPQIVVLDEAFSALDVEREQKVSDSLNVNFFRDKTVFCIAHRLSTLKNCNRILVIHNGQLSEQGTYHSLTSDTSSIFSKLMTQQFTH